jgi:endoglucanase
MSSRIQRTFAVSALLATAATIPAVAQEGQQPLVLAEAGYYEAPAVNVLVFSNWYDGLFADAKHSGVELVQQGERIATNGDVRLSATPGQWDPIGRLVSRTVDEATGTIEVLLEYPEHQFRYRIVARPEGGAVKLTVVLDQPLPSALAGRAGFNLEFLPSAYFHKSFMMDGRAAGFPLHPASDMTVTNERNAASGREIGPGAEPLPMASGSRLVLAPEDPARRVTIAAGDGSLALYDGRNQAQNGWFVVRGLIPSGRTGAVIEWTLSPNSVPGWLREPVIGHSQLGYAPRQAKRAVIELDAGDTPRGPVRLLRVSEAGDAVEALSGPAEPWGRYLRYNYATFDFSQVREPGLYQLEYAGQRTAAFRIGEDVYDAAWHPGLDVYMPVIRTATMRARRR